MNTKEEKYLKDIGRLKPIYEELSNEYLQIMADQRPEEKEKILLIKRFINLNGAYGDIELFKKLITCLKDALLLAKQTNSQKGNNHSISQQNNERLKENNKQILTNINENGILKDNTFKNNKDLTRTDIPKVTDDNSKYKQDDANLELPLNPENTRTSEIHNSKSSFSYKNIYVCTCKKFKTQDIEKLREHIFDDINYKPYKCKICREAFLSKEQIGKHMKKKHDSNDGFIYNEDDSKHKLYASILEEVTKKNPVKSTSQSDLNKNRVIKTKMNDSNRGGNSKPQLFCPECLKCFKNSNDLRLHLYKEINYFPFVCRYCKQSFVNSDVEHMKKHHPSENPLYDQERSKKIEDSIKVQIKDQLRINKVVLESKKSLKDGRYSCTHEKNCQFSSSTCRALHIHILRHTLTQPVYKCAYCYLYNKTEEKLEKHCSSAHKLKKIIKIIPTTKAKPKEGTTCDQKTKDNKRKAEAVLEQPSTSKEAAPCNAASNPNKKPATKSWFARKTLRPLQDYDPKALKNLVEAFLK